MNRVIFTVFDDINFSGQFDSTNLLLIKEYFSRLIDNKEQYAKHINADFKFFYNTMKEFNIELNESQFTKVNLYKHHLMDTLANRYDEVMYVDMDVLFNTTDNVFKVHNLNNGIHIKDQNNQIDSKDIHTLLLKNVGLRSPSLKYHITKDMLNGKDNNVLNTGVVIGKRDHIKQLKFIERLPSMISLLNNIKNNNINVDNQSYLRTMYYANNESFFSYLLEKYNIPYVILSDEWHRIYNDYDPADHTGVNGKILHFINKKFNRFFADKSKAIFSLYIKIEDEQLDHPPTNCELEPIGNKSKRTQIQFEKYYNDLVIDKQLYAKNINADFILFENDDIYNEFRKKFPSLSEFDVVNLYKIYCLDQLTKQYDLVCYLDFDVFCRRKRVDIFENVPCEYAVCCEFVLKGDRSLPYEENFDHFKVDFRSPQAKYWNAHALLSNEDVDSNPAVFNTGIIAASNYVMEKLDYFGDIQLVIEKMKQLKEDEDSMYPEKVRKSFGFDNESIFAYKVKKNKMLTYNLVDPEWHSKHLLTYFEAYDNDSRKNTINGKIAQCEFNSHCFEKNPVFIHFISKQFGLVFDSNAT